MLTYLVMVASSEHEVIFCYDAMPNKYTKCDGLANIISNVFLLIISCNDDTRKNAQTAITNCNFRHAANLYGYQYFINLDMDKYNYKIYNYNDNTFTDLQTYEHYTMADITKQTFNFPCIVRSIRYLSNDDLTDKFSLKEITPCNLNTFGTCYNYYIMDKKENFMIKPAVHNKKKICL